MLDKKGIKNPLNRGFRDFFRLLWMLKWWGGDYRITNITNCYIFIF